MKKLFIPICVSLLISSNFAKDEIKKEPTRLESYTKLQKVISAVELLYVDDMNLSQIIDKSINGLLHELDAHSSMLNQDSYKQMKVETKGEFGGLGIVVGKRDGALTVISPIDDTPAFKAGVKAGDIILKINKESTLNMNLSDAVDIMRGKVGTPIEITVVRKGETEPLKIKIIRDTIKIESVTAKMINKNILYLRIASFMDMNVADDLTKFIKQYKKETKAIIIDLRNNPGGLLDQAIKTIDLFVDKGIAVSQKGRDKADDEYFQLHSDQTITKVPMVVLVNEGSASASEIVSGGLQDLKRAVIVGKTTFGKGSVQRIIPITPDQSEAIKLTIAKYYLPSGRTIQAKGIVPDIKVFAGEVLTQKESDFIIKEKELRKHLKVELDKITDIKEDDNKTKEDKTIITPKQILKDNQLKTAIDIIKSLILMKN